MSCLTVRVQGRDLSTGTVLRGCMHLVDLAGRDVISSLAQRNPHVPYRNSKLAQVLQDSLGGQAKTLMFVHISPEPDALAETIASLKAALARKEEETEQSQQSIISSTGSSEKYRTKASSDLSPLSPNHLLEICWGRDNSWVMGVRRLLEFSIKLDCLDHHDAFSTQLRTNTTLRQEKNFFALDELLAISPSWPPVTSPTQNFWMTRKNRTRGSGWIRFSMAANDYTVDLDAATSDTSEPYLLWQFNQSKLSSITNGIGIGSKAKKPIPKPASTPEQRKKLHPMPGPSPSKTQGNGVGQLLHRNGRQPAPADGKRKTGSRK
ncbi:hypothetical protein F3Y22_tig00005459pilonHSYRG00314 [Hibiscus syriacus]|uniref:Kinesin motor domain-containing protein n=1 Tax=Hibiscus syriacus TaxID=106335 RepID=A0A6A3CE35_HIBSY|nr:hypothetical protein F3Y22_tig00005459pilonHSYRG00314 [Hibiscus syriacus]